MPEIGGGAGLFLDMGLGKTLITVSLINYFQFRRSLIVAPKNVILGQVWQNEFAKHIPDHPFKIVQLRTKSGGSRKARELFQEASAIQITQERMGVPVQPLVFIINYELMWHDGIADTLLEGSLDLCAIDEGHRIKAPGGRASLFLKALGQRVKYRLDLTGTPQPHDPLDIYAQYRFLDPGVFGTSFQRFKERYAYLDEYGSPTEYKNEDELTRKMYSIAFRAKRSELNLPETMPDIERKFEIGPVAKRYYEALARNSIVGIGSGTLTASNVLTRILRLAQITSGYAPLDSHNRIDNETAEALREANIPFVDTQYPREQVEIDTSKADTLREVLEDLPHDYVTRPTRYEPVVIFYRFQWDCDVIKRVCSEFGMTCAELNGQRNQLLEWQRGDYDAIAVQIQAGGVGISLVRAHYAIYYSLDLSLANHQQSRARLDRPGQTQSVQFIYLLASNTVDESNYYALAHQQDVVTRFVDTIREDQEGAMRQIRRRGRRGAA